jgi:predicted O-methyltransferase YrrM
MDPNSMLPATWEKVDTYIEESVVHAEASLAEARAASDRAGLPQIAVSAAQGKLLRLLARAVGAGRILEIGTLGGYSTIWLAGGLAQGGRLVSLEVDPRHAEVARENVERAGFGSVVEVRLGPALETLGELEGPFDLVFIDADKPNTAAYFERAVELSRPGTVIVVDNVVRAGGLADPPAGDASAAAMRGFHDALGRRSDVEATTVQTVGSKGYDGFTLALVKG